MKDDKGLVYVTVSLEGSDTPVGVPSGDEGEVTQWNQVEAVRDKEEHDLEEDNSPLPGLCFNNNTVSSSEQDVWTISQTVAKNGIGWLAKIQLTFTQAQQALISNQYFWGQHKLNPIEHLVYLFLTSIYSRKVLKESELT